MQDLSKKVILVKWFAENYSKEVWERFKCRMKENGKYNLSTLAAHESLCDFIKSPFRWYQTDEGVAYWRDIGDAWIEYLKGRSRRLEDSAGIHRRNVFNRWILGQGGPKLWKRFRRSIYPVRIEDWVVDKDPDDFLEGLPKFQVRNGLSRDWQEYVKRRDMEMSYLYK